MDAATGLLYVGNGQYYDPTTGRFLTRDAKPNSSNPYVPWDPTGAIIGPLGVAALFFVKRKRGSKWGTLFVILLVVGSIGMTIAACGPSTPAPNPTTPAPQVPPTQTPGPIPSETPTPTPPSTPTAPPAPTNTPLIDGDCGIPPAIYTYPPCTASGSNTCIDQYVDSPVVQIAHTVQGEGGAFSDTVAANVLQTILNRAYTYWVFTHHRGINPDNIPWNQINRARLTDLFLFILSEPGGEGWPSYNAWRADVPRSGPQWEHIVGAVENLLNNAGAPTDTAVIVNQERPASAIRTDTNVQWYGATNDPEWRPPNGFVHYDDIVSVRADSRRVFCGRQFYGNNGVIRPPQAVIACPE
jgi:hypothetical protein